MWKVKTIGNSKYLGSSTIIPRLGYVVVGTIMVNANILKIIRVLKFREKKNKWKIIKLNKPRILRLTTYLCPNVLHMHNDNN